MLHTFGSICYAPLPPQLHYKLSPQAAQCVFLGYGDPQKGFIFHALVNKELTFLTMQSSLNMFLTSILPNFLHLTLFHFSQYFFLYHHLHCINFFLQGNAYQIKAKTIVPLSSSLIPITKEDPTMIPFHRSTQASQPVDRKGMVEWTAIKVLIGPI